MDLEDKVYNLEHSVNELRISMSGVEATLSSVAKQSDININNLNNLKSDLGNLKVDLTELKTEYKSPQPRLVTKTWLATSVILIVVAQIFVPILQDYIHFKPSSSVNNVKYKI